MPLLVGGQDRFEQEADLPEKVVDLIVATQPGDDRGIAAGESGESRLAPGVGQGPAVKDESSAVAGRLLP